MKTTQRLLICLLVALFALGCTDSPKSEGTKRASQAADTLYTRQAAMSIYAYQPRQALQIIDSAVIVGNLSEWQAQLCKARIFSSTQMYDELDSLLGGPKDVRLDTARAIGERLLSHDSVKTDLKRQLDVMEILSQTDRMLNDTVQWLQRLNEYAAICRQLGDSQATNALRTEAEIGAALCALGQWEQGMAKLDSAIYQLDASFYRKQNRGTFDELDALIVALKRKIVQLGSHNKYAETLPLARLIIERLDDYEQHPDRYHDGTHREPKNDEKRADYIRFYRGQAQNYTTAAYASLGKQANMLKAFQLIEDGVRQATAREHHAHFIALQQQLEAERQQTIANKSKQATVTIGILALLFLVFAIVVYIKNRTISRKNRLLGQQIAESIIYKKKYWEEKRAQKPDDAPADISTLDDQQLFGYINETIVRERLFLDPRFGRQAIIDRFHLPKSRVSSMISKGSDFDRLTNYIQQLRLEYAAKLLIEHPDKSIAQVAIDSGFSSNNYFCNCFRQHFSLSPSEFRKMQ